MRELHGNLIIGLALLVCAAGPCCADEVLRDPTRPYKASVPAAKAAAPFSVSAIIISADRRVAIVNGQSVGVGGSVYGATVVAIEKDYLILDRNGKRITARLRD